LRRGDGVFKEPWAFGTFGGEEKLRVLRSRGDIPAESELEAQVMEAARSKVLGQGGPERWLESVPFFFDGDKVEFNFERTNRPELAVELAGADWDDPGAWERVEEWFASRPRWYGRVYLRAANRMNSFELWGPFGSLNAAATAIGEGVLDEPSPEIRSACERALRTQMGV
jgi:hypothetical protein